MPFVEDGAHSLSVEPETESVILSKLSDLCFALTLVCWPETFQIHPHKRHSASIRQFATHVRFDARESLCGLCPIMVWHE